MTLDHDQHDADARDQLDADARDQHEAAHDAGESEEDGPQYVMQGIITIALFGAFVAFALFCLPFYIFN